jgi:hypothetical protein
MPIIEPPSVRDAFTQRVVEHQGENPLAMLDQAVSFMDNDAFRLYRATKLAEWGEVDVDALVETLKGRLDEARSKPHLHWVDYRDGLNSEQVQALIDGENVYESSAFTYLTESLDEAAYEEAQRYVREDLCESDEERDALDADPDAFDTVRFAVQDTDTSNWYKDFLRQADNMLFRYSIDHEVNPWASQWSDVNTMDDERADLAEALGLDVERYREPLDSVLNECAYYGGSVEVIWYGDAETALALAARGEMEDDRGRPVRTAPTLGKIIFTDAHLVVRDGLNGAGHDVKIEGDLTLPWVAGRVNTDKHGGGVSWTEIAGPYEPAYAPVDISTERDPVREAAVAFARAHKAAGNLRYVVRALPAA